MSDQQSPTIRDLELDKPIVRGDTKIERLQIRKPEPGECRGLTMSDIGNGKVDTLITLLPRITIPPLTELEVSKLDLADMTEVTGIVVDFLFTRARRAALPTT